MLFHMILLQLFLTVSLLNMDNKKILDSRDIDYFTNGRCW